MTPRSREKEQNPNYNYAARRHCDPRQPVSTVLPNRSFFTQASGRKKINAT
jgi:hypothetical protein